MGHRLLITALIVFIGTSFLAAILQGGGGIVYTQLTDDVADNAAVIPVISTGLFNSQSDIIRVGNEKIMYSSKNATAFMVYERGYDDTKAEAFEAGRHVYSTEAGILNDAMGYNVGVSIESSGAWGVVMVPINFFTNTLPHLIVLNANLFKEGSALSIIAIFWYAFGIALLVVLAIQIAPIAVAITTGLFGLIRR